jgi:hypothetical protein
LLSQAETPPTFLIHCRGTHDETHTRFVNKTDSQGRQYTESENDTETVTDFDFKIAQPVPPRALQWTVADGEPAYRGRMNREVGLPGDTTKADGDTKKQFKDWREERRKRGLPPWVGPDDERREGASFRTDVLKSSWTLRQWADDYCQSQKIFKEFAYEKVRPDLSRPSRLILSGGNSLTPRPRESFRSSTDGTSAPLRQQFGQPSNQQIIMEITSKLALSQGTGP